MNARRGKLITFEGGEGAGKSTQVGKLVSRLRQQGLPVIPTREPGGSPHAERLRTLLLSGRAEKLGPISEAVLFSAARIDHVDNLISPALSSGSWVVCDRYIDSTRAYQGAPGRVPAGLIRALELVSVGENWPDLTVLVDLSPEVGLARASHRRGLAGSDRFESENLAFHAALRRAYLDMAQAEPERFFVVDGEKPADEVSDRIWDRVSALLPSPARASS